MAARKRSSVAEFTHQDGAVDATLQFLKRVHSELRTLRKVHVWPDHFQVIDVNGDYFEVHGAGYAHPEIVPLLRAVYTVFDPQSIHEPATGEYKEFLTGRRHPWAEDRVM